MTVWVEVVCDECARQATGTSYGRRSPKRELLRRAKRRGWKITREQHLCSECLHREQNPTHRTDRMHCLTCGWPE